MRLTLFHNNKVVLTTKNFIPCVNKYEIVGVEPNCGMCSVAIKSCEDGTHHIQIKYNEVHQGGDEDAAK